jgi:orotate phosphoribosyltransferase
MERGELAARVFERSYLTGSFKLRSGRVSDHYFDKYQFESDPELLREVAAAMTAIMPRRTEVLAGLELGGVPIATAISLATGLPTVFVRKRRKEYGTRRITEGIDIDGKRVCMIEDVITTGGQVAMSARDLRGEGAIVDTVCCAIFRGEGDCEPLAEAAVRMIHLFDMSELMPHRARPAR